jgi:4-hydroxythreonine-4-phosphate dehydrogenase
MVAGGFLPRTVGQAEGGTTNPKDAERPLVAVTMGDPAGIGPEVVIRALTDENLPRDVRIIVVGSRGLLEERAGRFSLPFGLRSVAEPEECQQTAGLPALYEPEGLELSGLELGVASPRGGRASLAYIDQAVDWALAGRVEALVTGPINKEALSLAGCAYPGHTELLASRTGSRRATMMLVGGGLRVALATTHVPLRRVAGLLSTERLVTTIQVTDEALREWFGVSGPRIAVCALNPHAGDGGRLGTEDATTVAPAVAEARAKGVTCEGPLPADALFYHAKQGRYDAVVALYHDQGLIPVKLLAFEQAVNVTLGLPIIRTSVDHGTGYDIVSRGVASCQSLVEAVKLAAAFIKRRQSKAGLFSP